MPTVMTIHTYSQRKGLLSFFFTFFQFFYQVHKASQSLLVAYPATADRALMHAQGISLAKSYIELTLRVVGGRYGLASLYQDLTQFLAHCTSPSQLYVTIVETYYGTHRSPLPSNARKIQDSVCPTHTSRHSLCSWLVSRLHHAFLPIYSRVQWVPHLAARARTTGSGSLPRCFWNPCAHARPHRNTLRIRRWAWYRRCAYPRL